jgi:hypothetical protein
MFLFATTNPSQAGLDKTQEQLIKQACMVAGQQTNELVNHLKEEYGVLTPSQRLAKQHNEAQLKLTELQIEDLELGNHLKRLDVVSKTCGMLKSDDKEAADAFARAKAEMNNKIKNFPELPKKETPEAKNSEIKQPTNSLLSMAAAPFVIVATKTGKIADTIANYSFAYVTNLKYLKGSFIDKHSIGINRALVAATAALITYKAYSLYTTKTHNNNDDDIFSDDNDY